MPGRGEKLIENFSFKPYGKSPLAKWEAKIKMDFDELK
jgi:hypothetical protein